MQTISPSEWDSQYRNLCSYFRGRKYNRDEAEFWYKRMRLYTAEMVEDSLDNIRAGSRNFPVLNEVVSILSSRNRGSFSSNDDAESRELSDAEKELNEHVFPVFLDWVVKSFGGSMDSDRAAEAMDRYLATMRYHSERLSIDIDWSEFTDRGINLPWVRPMDGS